MSGAHTCASGVVPRRPRTGASSSPCLNDSWVSGAETQRHRHWRRRTTVTTYPKPAGGAPNFPALETDVLEYWDSDDTFRASVARRE